MVLRDGDENLSFPVYGPCAAEFVAREGNRVSVSEESLYPFDETVTLRIKASAPWKVR
jgi:hypothetical protein